MSDPKIQGPRLPSNIPERPTSSEASQSPQGAGSRGPASVGGTSPPGVPKTGTSAPVRRATPAYAVPAVKPAGAQAPAPAVPVRSLTPSGSSSAPARPVSAAPGQATPVRTSTPSGSSPASSPSVAVISGSPYSARTLTPAKQPPAATVPSAAAPVSVAPVRTTAPAIQMSSVQPERAPEPPVRTVAQAYPVVATPTDEPVSPSSGGPQTMLLDGSMLEAVRARAVAASVARSSTPAAPSPAAPPANAVVPGTAISIRTRPQTASSTQISPVLVRSARPGALAATYQVVPARIDPSPFALPRNVDSHLPMLKDGNSAQAAAFRALRRRLAEQKDPRAILVTSAQDDEGKTTCAANLALGLAESGRLSVLLVEANLRRPQLSAIFGFQPFRCLRAQLAAHRKQIDDPWLTTELRPTGLHVLAVAPGAAEDENLHGPTFSASIARWRGAFDYVVIDGPSILTSCDASIIHDSMDAVVMVVRSGISRNREVRLALDQISADMVAGIVLMDSPTR
jgi:Mrp family chromosome partitioning ATPase